jgi:hypothetical protein
MEIIGVPITRAIRVRIAWTVLLSLSLIVAGCDRTTADTTPGSVTDNKPQLETSPLDPESGEQPATGSNGSQAARTDKSARSDELTGGKIETATYQPGQPDIRLTVNLPSFHLTFWQNGKEVKSYEIAVARPDFPMEAGHYRISQVIWNPEWVPPDSRWVNKMRRVQPGEHIGPTDKRNPLGKIKIPLGDGFLIHQIEGHGDIGHLVSHGCIRMQESDLLDLAEKIIYSRGAAIPQSQIDHAMNTSDRLVARVNPAVPLDVAYDTAVIEGGVLHVYPDIYKKRVDSVEILRSDLQSAGVDAAGIDAAMLARIAGLPNRNEGFVVSVADIKSGNALSAGRKEPLTRESQQRTATTPHPAKRRRRG